MSKFLSALAVSAALTMSMSLAALADGKTDCTKEAADK